jgi:hypothetical protein
MVWMDVKARIRRIVITLAALLLLEACVASALACRDPESQQTIFVDHFVDRLVARVDASIIAQVTITDVSTTADNDYFVGFARVDRVLKGTLEAQSIRILSLLSDCNPAYDAGAKGIVAGAIRRNVGGVPELIAVSMQRQIPN